MSNITLGQLITTEQKRDAVHVAVAPATAKETLFPGVRIKIKNGYANIAQGNEPAVAVVDPFLTTIVPEGRMFWAFMFPNTTKNLRHDWDHEAFEVSAPQPPEEDPDPYHVCCPGP